MRPAAAAILSTFLWLASCGYVGPVVPPSPELPAAVRDLAVVERGDQLVITFSTPARTTDNLAITRFSEIDLGLGPLITPFDFDQWAASARHYELSVPPPNGPDDPAPKPISKSLSVAGWEGKRVAVLVRTAVRKSDHFSPWSNRIVLDVVPPIPPPVVQVKPVKEGYMLTWQAGRPQAHYQVLRQSPTDKQPIQIGTADASPYVDTKSQWDTRYTYVVVAKQGSAESLPSKPVSILSANIFPPSVPVSLTALAGPESVELSWSRVPESDLKGYYVYRSVDGGPFTRRDDLTNLPTYSDRKVEHGKTYHYAVSAVNQNGFESEKSPVTELTF